ncbi:CoA-disulfide reductase [Romboutsia sp.]|uniref:CoA-disulfide reductase n=1 Tax=Romboutsia sp. TaxID=1965302 RepID=UPI003F36D116
MKVVVVGGVAGGASACARLRRLDENAEIIMVEKGDYISFANCGLPYYIGGDIKKRSALVLQTPESFNTRFNVDVRVLSEAVAIDRENKTVSIKNINTGETYLEAYDKLILSPGAKPFVPPIEGATNSKVFTLRNIPDTLKIKEYVDEEFPESAVIVGAGFIGIEMAENLKQAGLDVTLVEMSDHVIASLDYDMACDVHNYLREKGINLILNDKVSAILEDSDKLTIKLDNDEITTDMVIMSVGVRPDTKLAQEAGIELNTRGAIVVDEYMQTSDNDIYAVGDAIEITEFVTNKKSHIPLAGPANKQGRIVADNICGIKTRYKNTQGSSILKIFDMTVAATGITEAVAKANNLDYDKVFTYSASHAGYYPGANNMSIKTIYEKSTGKILGAQVVGFDGVDKRCDVLAVAIRGGMTAYDLTELEMCYAPPFGSAKDPVNFAGYVIENHLTDKVKNFHWHDIENLPRDGSITLLDVRTNAEVENGRIDGFIHIPVDDLRNRLDELDNTKPIYVHCHSGLRSYIGCRILSAKGFDCYNLSGGYRLYSSIINSKIAEHAPCYIK